MAELTDEQRAKFLAAIQADREIGNRAAMRQAGATTTGANGEPRPLTGAEVSALLAGDPELRDDYETARGRHPERIRAAYATRAIDGVDEPVFHNGEIVGHIRKYSDTLLKEMGRAALPEYRDTQRVEMTGADGGPVVTEDRSASLADVLAVLRAADLDKDPDDGGGTSGSPVADAPHVLPDPS